MTSKWSGWTSLTVPACIASTGAWSRGASTSTPMCTGVRGSSKLPRIGCTAVLGANGHPPGDGLVRKQRASTLRSVNAGLGAGPGGGSGAPPPVDAGGGEVVVGSVAAGLETTTWAGAFVCRWRACLAGVRCAPADGAGVVGDAPDTDHCHNVFEWWIRRWGLRNAVAREGVATTTPVVSEAVQRRVRAMILVMVA